MITSDQVSRLNEAAQKLLAAQAGFNAVMAEMADSIEQTERPAKGKGKRRARAVKRPGRVQPKAPSGPRMMRCPRCDRQVETTSRVGIAVPVPHDDPDGVPCRRSVV